MRLIPKEKLISIMIGDLRDFRKIASKLYTREMESVLLLRVDKVYNLNYTLNNEQRIEILDLFNTYIYKVDRLLSIAEFRDDLRSVLK